MVAAACLQGELVSAFSKSRSSSLAQLCKKITSDLWLDVGFLWLNYQEELVRQEVSEKVTSDFWLDGGFTWVNAYLVSRKACESHQ